MAKIAVVLTDEMDAALKRIAGTRGATVSNLVRMALLEWLEQNGEKVEDTGLRWGGYRRREQEEQPEDAAVLATEGDK